MPTQQSEEIREAPPVGPSKYKHIGKVLYAGFFYLLIQSSYNPAQNLVSSLFNQKGYSGLGQLTLFTNWTLFGLANLLTSHVKRYFRYGTGMFLGNMGYAVFYVGAFYLTSCETEDGLCSPTLIYIANILGSCLCGLVTPLAFVSISSFVDSCSQTHNKGFYYGIMTGSMFSSQLTGNLAAAYVLGDFSPAIFFLICFIVTVVAASALLFLPSISPNPQASERKVQSEKIKTEPVVFVDEDESAQETSSQTSETVAVASSLRGSWREYGRLMLDSRMQRLVFSFANTGVIISLYSGFFYTVITKSIDSQDEATINKYTAYVFVVLGAFECIAGLGVGKVSDMMNKVNALKYSGLVVELSYVVTFIAYYREEYYLCLIAGAFWGFSDCMTQTLHLTLIGTEFNGQLEAFGLYYLFQGTVGAVGYLVELFTSSLKGEYYLFIMLAWQIFVHWRLLGLKSTRT